MNLEHLRDELARLSEVRDNGTKRQARMAAMEIAEINNVLREFDPRLRRFSCIECPEVALVKQHEPIPQCSCGRTMRQL